MRVAFISDIHGNLPPLEAVVDDIGRSNVQSIVCLGDVATIGIQPHEVIGLLQRLECRCIMGNHDLALIDPQKMIELSLIAEDLFHSLHWTIDRISTEQLQFIRSFKTNMMIGNDHGKQLLCYHGTPLCNHIGIHSATPEAEIEHYLDGIPEKVLVGGHTHQQMKRIYEGRTLLNPGSVGSVFDSSEQCGKEINLRSWAEYAIVEFARERVSVEMKKIPFDTEKAKALIRSTDHPLKEWWKKQYVDGGH
jgi:putative phosphoesterase